MVGEHDARPPRAGGVQRLSRLPIRDARATARASIADGEGKIIIWALTQGGDAVRLALGYYLGYYLTPRWGWGEEYFWVVTQGGPRSCLRKGGVATGRYVTPRWGCFLVAETKLEKVSVARDEFFSPHPPRSKSHHSVKGLFSAGDGGGSLPGKNGTFPTDVF